LSLSIPDILANCCTFCLLIPNPGKCPLELIQERFAGRLKCCFFDEGSGRLDRPHEVPCLGPVGAGHTVKIRDVFITLIDIFFSLLYFAVDSTSLFTTLFPLIVKRVTTFIFDNLNLKNIKSNIKKQTGFCAMLRRRLP
jgi:hypothetical protein